MHVAQLTTCNSPIRRKCKLSEKPCALELFVDLRSKVCVMSSCLKKIVSRKLPCFSALRPCWEVAERLWGRCAIDAAKDESHLQELKAVSCRVMLADAGMLKLLLVSMIVLRTIAPPMPPGSSVCLVAQFVKWRLRRTGRDRRCAPAAARSGGAAARSATGPGAPRSIAVRVRPGDDVAKRRRHLLDAENAGRWTLARRWLGPAWALETRLQRALGRRLRLAARS